METITPGKSDSLTELREEIKQANRAYHGSARPVMSDAEYDVKMRQLDMLEHLAGAVPADSPSQTVGTPPAHDAGEIAHDPPMLSLRKADDPAQLRAWTESVPRESRAFDISLKCDGLAVALRYQGGQLVYAATRGDGRTGEDITEAASLIPSVPTSIETTGDIEVRGEIVALNNLFERHNRVIEAQGEEPYASPRNFAAGTLRAGKQDPERLATLVFVPYWAGGLGTSHQSEIAARLTNLGFQKPWISAVTDSPERILRIFELTEKSRDQIPYDADGLVVRVNDNLAFDALGARSNAPNGAVAYKFASVSAVTVLAGVSWQVGRTGVITPKAELQPVRVGDVVVSSATLHNPGYMAELDLRIGDSVTVVRAGDVIPAVTAVDAEARNGGETPVEVPSLCPSCKQQTTDDPPRVRCTNIHCPAQAQRAIEHFAARDYMDIEHLGPSTIETLIGAGLLSSPADLYDLAERRESIAALEGMGQSSAERLIESIERSKDRPLSRVLAALGIREVGRSASRDIAAAAGDMNTAVRMSAEQLTELPDIGEIMAHYYRSYMERPDSVRLIERLSAAGVNMTEPKNEVQKDSQACTFAGKTIVVTGKVEGHTRDSMNALIFSLGARPSGSVSKKTDYVVVGERPGATKYNKAVDLGITMLEAGQFLSMASA